MSTDTDNSSLAISFLFSPSCENDHGINYFMDDILDIDVTHMNNIYKLVHVYENSYRILRIYKQTSQFEVNDVVFITYENHWSNKIISIHTEDEDGDIEKMDTSPSFIKKEKDYFDLCHKEVDEKFQDLVDIYHDFHGKYADLLHHHNGFYGLSFLTP